MDNPSFTRAAALAACLIIAVCWVAPLPVQAAEAPVTECDHKAANSQDHQRPDGVAGILELGRINAAAAMAACKDAVARYPDSARLQYELARAIIAETIETSHRDCEPALALLESSAQSGHAAAAMELSVCHTIGWGLPRNDRRGIEWARMAYELGSPTGMAKLAEAIVFGAHGYRKDVKQGRAILEKLAEAGNVEALNILAFKFPLFTGTRWDTETLLSYVVRLAELGDREAQSMLGRSLLKGMMGAPYDPDLGREMLLRAAEAGDRKAIEELRKLHASLPLPKPSGKSQQPAK